MDNASYSYTEHGYELATEEVKKQCDPAWQWLSIIHMHTWVRWAMDTNCKPDLVNSSLSEVFNTRILDVRSKPIVTMLIGIYDKQMLRFDGKSEGGETGRWEITPFNAEWLEMIKQYSRPCVPKSAVECGKSRALVIIPMRLTWITIVVLVGNGICLGCLAIMLSATKQGSF
jgi:hypothetical protein